MSKRQVRQARKDAAARKRTPHEVLEDLTRNAEELGLYEDSPLTLSTGERLDLREDWPTTHNRKE